MHTPRHGGRQGPNNPGRDCPPPTLINQRVYIAPDIKQKVRALEVGNSRGYLGPEGAPVPPTKYTVSKVTLGLVMAAGDVVQDIVTNSGGLFR